MARINSKLLERLESKLNVRREQIYKLIAQKVRETHLPRHLAAIALAAERGINISRFAREDDLAAIRQAGYRVSETVSTTAPQRVPPKVQRTIQGRERRRGTSIFVVHGRNERLRRELFAFLRSIGLNPMEWRRAIALTGKPSPYVGEILEAAFRKAVAVVVILSPDDEAKLKSRFVRSSDPPEEKNLTGQPRPNVLFEAGMAFGKSTKNTVLVQVGKIRHISDIAGRHVVRLSNSAERRQELITKLENAGCIVDMTGSDWLTEGDFEGSV